MNSKMFDGLHSVTVRRGQKRIQDDLVVEEPLRFELMGMTSRSSLPRPDRRHGKTTP